MLTRAREGFWEARHASRLQGRTLPLLRACDRRRAHRVYLEPSCSKRSESAFLSCSVVCTERGRTSRIHESIRLYTMLPCSSSLILYGNLDTTIVIFVGLSIFYCIYTKRANLASAVAQTDDLQDPLLLHPDHRLRPPLQQLFLLCLLLFHSKHTSVVQLIPETVAESSSLAPNQLLTSTSFPSSDTSPLIFLNSPTRVLKS